MYSLIDGVGQLVPQTWFNSPKPGLQSRALCGTLCALSIAKSKYDPLLACQFCFILYYLVMRFCILVQDYTLCFVGSPY